MKKKISLAKLKKSLIFFLVCVGANFTHAEISCDSPFRVTDDMSLRINGMATGFSREESKRKCQWRGRFEISQEMAGPGRGNSGEMGENLKI